MLNKIKCRMIGHNIVKAGSCPFTGKTYEACVRCGKMREV